MHRRLFVSLPFLASVDLRACLGADSGKGMIRNAERMPYYVQPDGISCGPTSASMVLKYYGKSAGIGPLKTASDTRFYEGPNLGGKPIKVGLTMPRGVKAGLEKYGVLAKVHSGASISDLVKAVDGSRPPIVLVRSGWDTWHWIVVVGYEDNGRSLVVHDPGTAESQTLTAKELQMGWNYSGTYHGKELPNPKCHTCAGTGKVNAPNPNLQCPICSGSGKVKLVIDTPFGKVEKGFGKCHTCGGSGRMKGELPKINCVVCSGKGKLPEIAREFVAKFAPKNSMVVPEYAPIINSAAKPGSDSKPMPKPVVDRPGVPLAKVLIEYTIRNDSGKQVHFTMQPSGKTYTLDPGKTFDGKSYQINGKPPTMKVTQSGRNYELVPGRHRFTWIREQNRFGFEFNVK